MARRQRARLYDEVLSGLGRRIVGGDLGPGTVLDPAGLGVEHGVSRTVVREVLRGLGSRGLVTASPRSGTVVNEREDWVLLDPAVLRWRFETRPDDYFLEELTELRQVIEPAIARFAAERRTDHDIAALSDALSAMEASDTKKAESHIDADVRFHHALLRSAHNELFEHMSVIIEIGLRCRDRYVISSGNLAAPGSHEEIIAAHAEVLEAVRKRRRHSAEMAMRGLLNRSAQDNRSVQRTERQGQKVEYEVGQGQKGPVAHKTRPL
ncbi:hypothetical protein SA2016_0972 [Sinomonas atrocyanea]|uniref:HTH gntR-type domain-containing protein n=1 Tax=Sinomonas atrocyanea TaxID=37927 RepID=A0A126ZXH4_9MICC|nr:FCD domain-containing protein [Sinomonas atrocyanea]AMM31657.1 hypothetical protein SA2016_0972 [Sinomonas atrocyanea]GEB64191.1 GntR family transcriptional regulator [Sinomonas atrocyanea]GGG57074.1 GntR family transcriptional regulator [Sinomonas atrocyanea]